MTRFVSTLIVLISTALVSPSALAQSAQVGGQYECRVTHSTSTGRLTLTCTPEDGPVGTSATDWEATGSGSDLISIPDSVYLFRIEADATLAEGGSENFVVWCGIDSASQRGGLLVNEIIGPRRNVTSWSSTHPNERDYNGRGQPCRQLTVKYGTGIRWTMTEVSSRSGQTTMAYGQSRRGSSVTPTESADVLRVLEKRAEREGQRPRN